MLSGDGRSEPVAEGTAELGVGPVAVGAGVSPSRAATAARATAKAESAGPVSVTPLDSRKVRVGSLDAPFTKVSKCK